MKKLIFTIVLLTCWNNIEAQMIIEEGLNGVLIETKASSILEEMEGSPYLNEDFRPGEVNIEGKDVLKVFLRYDVSTEMMEIKTDLNDSKVYKLSPAINATYAISGDQFFYDQIQAEGDNFSGFFKIHYIGDNYSLLEKPIIDIKKAQKAKSGYEEDKPAQISIDSKYFITAESGAVHHVRIKHRDIKKIFESEKAKAYLKDTKIRSVEDLITFLKHLDQ